MIWLSPLLWGLSAFFNSCMDAFENTPNFDESVFMRWDKRFWCKDVSWRHAKRVFGYKIDGWHLAKSAWIACAMIAGILYEPISAKLFQVPILNSLIDIALSGIVWIIGFNMFYHKLFKIK